MITFGVEVFAAEGVGEGIDDVSMSETFFDAIPSQELALELSKVAHDAMNNRKHSKSSIVHNNFISQNLFIAITTPT